MDTLISPRHHRVRLWSLWALFIGTAGTRECTPVRHATAVAGSATRCTGAGVALTTFLPVRSYVEAGRSRPARDARLARWAPKTLGVRPARCPVHVGISENEADARECHDIDDPAHRWGRLMVYVDVPWVHGRPVLSVSSA